MNQDSVTTELPSCFQALQCKAGYSIQLTGRNLAVQEFHYLAIYRFLYSPEEEGRTSYSASL